MSSCLCGWAAPGFCICRANSSWNINWPPRRSARICFVAMAAYGDYAPWYIGTAIAYEQGGYETSRHLPTSRRKSRAC